MKNKSISFSLFFFCTSEHFTNLVNSTNQSDQHKGFLYRGTSFAELNDHKKALEDYESGLKLNSKSFELKFKQGVSFFKLSEFEEADKSFRNALVLSDSLEEREKLLLWQNKTQLEVDNIKKEKEKKIGDIKFSYNWYQNDNSVIVTLDCNKIINKFTYKVEFSPTLFKVVMNENNNNIYKLYELDLYLEIDPEKCTYKLLTQKIELTLEKKEKGKSWITLDSKSANTIQSYPSSNKNKTDFNKINKDIEKELKDDKSNPEGNDAMMSLFKEIYANANEDTKKAMIKSYSTSGGTVFSTNWDEVKVKDYAGRDRPTAPDGQLWADEKK